MKDYIRLALIVALFIAGSAVESYGCDRHKQTVVITEPTELNTWQRFQSRFIYGLRSRLSAESGEFRDSRHTRRQHMRHGAGGCTPNHSTGGCL